MDVCMYVNSGTFFLRLWVWGDGECLDPHN